MSAAEFIRSHYGGSRRGVMLALVASPLQGGPDALALDGLVLLVAVACAILFFLGRDR